MGAIVFCFGFFLFLAGVIGLLAQNTQRRPNVVRDSYQAQQRKFRAAPRASQSARVLPSIDTSSIGAQPMASGIRGDFQRARLGQNITVDHPQRGPITGKILGTIRYTELWQRVKSPSEPWAPTGNQFTAHWLGNFMIYEWKENLWLLDEYDALTDKDIATHFAPYAKRFGESNETADVYFAFPPASWKMTDIGKFSVQSAEGSGLRLNVGATGRFIHASGDGGRTLVVEDYQSGSGGQDTAWIGYSITWDAIQKIN